MIRSGLALLLAGCAATATAPAYLRTDFERHIEFLASPELKGRDNNTDGGRRAAQYVADALKGAGCEPAVQGGWFHEFETKWVQSSERLFRGRNVAGFVRGRELPDEYVVVGAHFDARGTVKGKIQPGADDNASGVAMLIELARVFAKAPARRSVVFVSFDCEEDGLLGSKEYVKGKVQDPKDVVAFFVFDLIGGNFMPGETREIYAMGAEHSEALSRRIARTAAEERDIAMKPLGIYVIEGFLPRSDYAAYRTARVPFVFFSTGTPWYYHTEHDDASVINYDKLVLGAPYYERVFRETADDPARPEFIAKPAPDFTGDAEVIREGLKRAPAVEDAHRTIVRKQLEELDAIVADPKDGVGRMQKVMATYFGLVTALRPK